MARRRRRRRPPWWLLVLTVVAVVAIGILLTSGRGSSKPRLAVRAADVPAAVRAVEAKLGGTQRFTDINATAVEVNVFVAGDGATETAWRFAGGRLDAPGAPAATPADHGAFSLDGVALDRAEGIARAAVASFPDATLTRFALLRDGDGAGAVVWSVALRSSKGGLILVKYTAAGELIGADLR